MLAKKIGIDLGTTAIRVHLRGEGIVLDEPSVAAVDIRDGLLRAVGRQAQHLGDGREAGVRLVRPVIGGRITNREMAAGILAELVSRFQGRHRFFRPEVMLCVPAGAPGDERRMLIDAAMGAGARQAWLIESPLAAALGLDLPVAQSGPYCICDLGGGLVQVAVISLSGIVASETVVGGGERLDATLASLLGVDQATAEALKISVGHAVAPDEGSGAAAEGETEAAHQLAGAIQEWLGDVIAAVRRVRDQTSRRLASGMAERGFVLTGGGALIRGVDRYLASQTGVPFRVATQPRTCAVRGTGRALRDFEIVHRRQLYLGSR